MPPSERVNCRLLPVSLLGVQGLAVLYPALELLDVRRNCLVHSRDLLCLTELGSLTELLVEGNPLCVQCER